MKLYHLSNNLLDILRDFLQSTHEIALITEVKYQLGQREIRELCRSIERINTINPKWEIFYIGRETSRDRITRIDSMFIVDESNYFKSIAYVLRRRFAFRLVEDPEVIKSVIKICLQRSLIFPPVEKSVVQRIAFVDVDCPANLKFLEPYKVVQPSETPDILVTSAKDTKSYLYNCKRKVLFNYDTSSYYDPEAYDFVFDTVKRVDGRTLWVPRVIWEHGIEGKEQLRERNKKITKSRFCSFVSNNDFPLLRQEIFIKLCNYKKVDSGGPVLNNIDRLIPGDHTSEELIKFYMESKFVFCCEDDDLAGHITEKILNAFVAATIPIYMGCQEVKSIFNPKAFIHINDYPTIEALIERIKEIDEDDDFYRTMINEPMFAFEEIPDNMKFDKLRYLFESACK